MADLSHRPHKLSTTLSAEQDAVVVELRRVLLLPLDELLVISREFVCAQLSRAALDRCLRRGSGLRRASSSNFLQRAQRRTCAH